MHQPEKDFVREGDFLFVEKLEADINAPCVQDDPDKRKITLLFKRPDYNNQQNEENIDIYLQITDSKVKKYNMTLKKIASGKGVYEDSLGHKNVSIHSKRLDEEGIWQVKIIYSSKNETWDTPGFVILNSGRQIDGRIEVEPRVSVSILDTNRKALKITEKGIKDSTTISIAGIIISVFVMIIVARKSIFYMKRHHKEQIEIDKKREEERQISLLESLYTELNMISNPLHEFALKGISSKYELKGNLEWFKEKFEQTKINKEKKSGKEKQIEVPDHDVWYISVDKYLSNINQSVKDVETITLKKLIILINQKISMINYYKDLLRKVEPSEITKLCTETIIIIKETIWMVEDAKNFLELNFDFKQEENTSGEAL